MARIADSTKRPILRLVKTEEAEEAAPKSKLAQELTKFADDLELEIEMIKLS